MANRKYLMKYHIGSCNRGGFACPLCTNWEVLSKNSDAEMGDASRDVGLSEELIDLGAGHWSLRASMAVNAPVPALIGIYIMIGGKEISLSRICPGRARPFGWLRRL